MNNFDKQGEEHPDDDLDDLMFGEGGEDEYLENLFGADEGGEDEEDEGDLGSEAENGEANKKQKTD